MRRILFLLAPGLLAAWLAPGQNQRPDVKGSQDHPLVTRMPGFYIDSYGVKEFDAESITREAVGLGKYEAEGKVTRISYWLQPGVNAPSNLQVIRNYRNALQAIGAVTQWESRYNLHMKAARRSGSSSPSRKRKTTC